MTKTYENPPAALPITEEELVAFGIPVGAIATGEYRGEITTHGMWQLPTSYRALCVSSVFRKNEDPDRYKLGVVAQETIFGIRTMNEARESGYALEGRVSVGGRKVRGFTSSQLFELPDGRLVNVATIHACLNDQ